LLFNLLFYRVDDSLIMIGDLLPAAPQPRAQAGA